MSSRSPTYLLVLTTLSCLECSPGPITPEDAHPDGNASDAAPHPDDAGEQVATQAWVNSVPPDCSEFSSAPPRWQGTAPFQEPGHVRWAQSSRERELGVARTWDQPPPSRPSRFGPVLAATGVVYWTWSDWLDTGLEPAAGNLVHFESSSRALSRSEEPVETKYMRLPRMWLPPRDALYWNGGFLYTERREPTFDIGDAPADGPRHPGSIARDNSHPSIIQRYGHRDTWMAAWSPVTGDIVAFGGLAVISGCEAGVRWGTEVPDGGTGSIFVRENGEVVVSTYRHSWVLDGVTGEPLRDAAIGTSGDFGDLGKGVAYHPDCGLLVQSSPSSWFWMDLDSLSRGPRLAVDPERAGTDNWSGTPDCGLAVGTMRLARDGSVQYDVPVPSDFYPEFFTMASPPVPLADGGIAVISDPPGWFRIAPDGAITDQHMMNLSIVGLRNASEPLLAPDGTLHYMTTSGGEYRASATATGLVPGPFLWPNSGRNWARTNSVLPDE